MGRDIGVTFGQLPFVAAQAFNTTEHGQAAAQLFFTQWKKDPSVVVQRFKRVVRGGRASVQVDMIVVRRRELDPVTP